MAKALVLLFAILASVVTVSAQSFELKLIQSVYPVNRNEGIIWADVQVASDLAVKDLTCRVSLSYVNCVNFAAKPIPAKPVFSNSTNVDQSKWTGVSDNSDGTFQFHYWMDPNKSVDYLPAGELRKVMEFYLKTDKTIPDLGQLIITLDNFKVIGANGQVLATPSSRSITIELGKLPPPQMVIDLIEAPFVNRTTTVNNLSLRLDYLSSKPFKEMAFDVTSLVGWSTPAYSFISDPAGVTITPLTQNKWRVAIKANANFPISASYRKWFQLELAFPASASGNVEILLNNFSAKDSAGADLVTVTEIRKIIDLGKPVGGNSETVGFSVDSRPVAISLDNYKTFGYGNLNFGVNIDNLLKQVKAVSFQMVLPEYFEIEKVVSSFDAQVATVKQLELKGGLRTYQIDMIAKATGVWLPNPATDNPREFARVFVRFVDLPYGYATYSFKNIVAYQPDGQIVNATKAFDMSIDFASFYSRFRRGDCKTDGIYTNFGNGIVDRADLKLIEDYLAGRFPHPWLYQLWAMDYNGDGKINQKDVDDLTRDLGPNDVTEENTEVNATMLYTNSAGEFIFRVERTATLMVYNQLGSRVYTETLNSGRNLVALPLGSGQYYWNISSTQPSRGSLLISK